MATQLLVMGGTDGPGFTLVIENGKVVLKPLPGWNPEIMKELGAALSAVQAMEGLRQHAGITQALADSVGRFVITEMDRYLAQDAVGGKGAATVVVMPTLAR